MAIEKPEIEIRELSTDDLNDSLLKHYDRYQEIRRFWIFENDRWVLMDRDFLEDWHSERKRDLYFIEDWNDEERKKIIKIDFVDSIENGGCVFGAFDEKNHLVAFANMPGGRFGSNKQYIQLKQLHVSREYRNRGIGKSLFKLCAERAKSLGTEKIYISSNFSEETQGFYKGVGCVDAEEINTYLAEKEPYDRQLEYAVKSAGGGSTFSA
jgi:predicted N-acetyltransferase YhbS